MKNFLLTIITVITVTINANAQITYIGEIKVSTSGGFEGFYEQPDNVVIPLNNNKFTTHQWPNFNFKIFNLTNLTVEKTVYLDSLNYTKSETMDALWNLATSAKIFNTDDKIECAYTYDLASGGRRFVIQNEDGLVLFDKTYSEQNTRFGGYDIFENNKAFYMIVYIENSSNGSYEFYKLGGVPCDNCSSTSLSKNNLKGNNISVNLFPNPTSSILNIAFEGDNADVQYEIYAVNGNIVNSGYIMGENTSVDVSSLASGSYVCKLTNKNGFLYSSLFIKN